jgi:Protein of unknown function (DUF2283)
METAKLKPRQQVTADYDRLVDVLYVTLGTPEGPVEGDGLPGGVELDYLPSDGSPCGVTVIGFRRNGWHEKLEALAEIIAHHLDTHRGPLVETIRKIAAD